MLPAESLNLILPLPFSLAGKTTASISITEPTYPEIPNPKTLPISGLLLALIVT